MIAMIDRVYYLYPHADEYDKASYRLQIIQLVKSGAFLEAYSILWCDENEARRRNDAITVSGSIYVPLYHLEAITRKLLHVCAPI